MAHISRNGESLGSPTSTTTNNSRQIEEAVGVSPIVADPACAPPLGSRCLFGAQSLVLAYLANRDALFGLLRRTLRDDALAADVLQDLALFAGREPVGELQSSPRSFLFGAACRLALAARRRRGTVAEVDDDDNRCCETVGVCAGTPPALAEASLVEADLVVHLESSSVRSRSSS